MSNFQTAVTTLQVPGQQFNSPHSSTRKESDPDDIREEKVVRAVIGVALKERLSTMNVN